MGDEQPRPADQSELLLLSGGPALANTPGFMEALMAFQYGETHEEVERGFQGIQAIAASQTLGLQCRRTMDEAEIATAITLRRQVFLDELGRARQEERDAHDDDAVHFIAELPGQGVVGALRVYHHEPYLPGCKIGRVAVTRKLRGLGIGRQLMAKAHEWARRNGYPFCCLHAECGQQAFYERLGYVADGDIFDEAGAPHIYMSLRLR